VILTVFGEKLVFAYFFLTLICLRSSDEYFFPLTNDNGSLLARGQSLLESRRNLYPGKQEVAFVREEDRGKRLDFFGCVLCWLLEEVPLTPA